MAIVTLTGTTLGADVGPFDIYHTSEIPGNLIESGVSRSTLDSGWQTSEVYDVYIVRSTGTCTNKVDVNLEATPTPTATATPTPTATPTATPVGPTPTPTPATPTPTAATPTPTPTPTGVTPTPTATPTPTSALYQVTLNYTTTNAPNSLACTIAQTDTFYIDGAQLQTANYAYTDLFGNNPVINGYTLSDGTTYREVVNNGQLDPNIACAAATPTPTATVPTQYLQVRECGGFTTYGFSMVYASQFPVNGAIKVTGVNQSFPDGKCWEILDNAYTGVIDYAVTFDSFSPDCNSCTPDNTPTPTPSATPTATPTPTPQVTCTYVNMSSQGYSDPATACAQSANITYYHNGSLSYPITGDTIYIDSSCTSPLNGASQWYKVGNDNTAILVNSSGLIGAKTSC